jgi:hypothetical protein
MTGVCLANVTTLGTTSTVNTENANIERHVNNNSVKISSTILYLARYYCVP